MHYSGSKRDCIKFLQTKEPFMTLKPYNRTIPVNKQLSNLDIIALKQIYATPSKFFAEQNNRISVDLK